MPKIGVSKDSLEGYPKLPAGVYDFRVDGFDPKFAKEKPGKERSVNLRPKMVIINNPDPAINDKQAFINCNTAYPPEMFDFSHACGVRFENEDGDDPQFPGEFPGPDNDPSKWQYIGPLVGQTGQLEIAETTDMKGKPTTSVKRFFCRVPGCEKQHKESLF